jgi:hypothetical protein
MVSSRAVKQGDHDHATSGSKRNEYSRPLGEIAKIRYPMAFRRFKALAVSRILMPYMCDGIQSVTVVDADHA